MSARKARFIAAHREREFEIKVKRGKERVHVFHFNSTNKMPFEKSGYFGPYYTTPAYPAVLSGRGIGA